MPHSSSGLRSASAVCLTCTVGKPLTSVCHSHCSHSPLPCIIMPSTLFSGNLNVLVSRCAHMCVSVCMSVRVCVCAPSRLPLTIMHFCFPNKNEHVVYTLHHVYAVSSGRLITCLPSWIRQGLSESCLINSVIDELGGGEKPSQRPCKKHRQEHGFGSPEPTLKL